MKIRKIEIGDFDKGALETLSHLTDVGKISKVEFILFVNRLSEYHKIIVAEHKGKIVGMATLLIEPKLIHGCSFAGHLEDVVVHKEWRGRGIGEKLVREVIKMAKKSKCYRVTLYTGKDKENFYKKNGAKKSGIHMRIDLPKRTLSK